MKNCCFWLMDISVDNGTVQLGTYALLELQFPFPNLFNVGPLILKLLLEYLDHQE